MVLDRYISETILPAVSQLPIQLSPHQTGGNIDINVTMQLNMGVNFGLFILASRKPHPSSIE
jgi:hypothetical protein